MTAIADAKRGTMLFLMLTVTLILAGLIMRLVMGVMGLQCTGDGIGARHQGEAKHKARHKNVGPSHVAKVHFLWVCKGLGRVTGRGPWRYTYTLEVVLHLGGRKPHYTLRKWLFLYFNR